MAISLSTNISSLKAQRALSTSTNSLGQVLTRLSSGQRINRGSDDAAGLALSSDLDVRAQIFNQGLRNINDAASLFNVAEGALDSLTNIVFRQTELAQQAANGSLTAAQRASLQAENVSLQAEYSRILESTSFNGINLFAFGNGQLKVEGGGNAVDLDYLTRGSDLVGAGTYTSYGDAFLDTYDSTVAGALVRDINADGIDDIVAFYATGIVGGTEFDFHAVTYIGDTDGVYNVGSDVVKTVSYVDGGSLDTLDSLAASFAEESGKFVISVKSTTSKGTTENYFTVALNDGGGLGTPSVHDSGPTTNQVSSSASGDFNGDGVLDYFEIVNSDTQIDFFTQDTLVSEFQSLEQGSISLSSQGQAQSALDDLDELLTKLSQARGAVGASQSRLSSTFSNLQTQHTELKSASSRIKDADVAQEAASLVRLQILQQASTSILAQA
ncbi:MAG: hypothetical protein KDD44_10125, partial [Bdellovibrionales bacterium]|nr:hypothetical protein [Bdellovibrionales bacterium]